MLFQINKVSVVKKLLLTTLSMVALIFILLTGFLFQRTSSEITRQAEVDLRDRLALIAATFQVFDSNVTQATNALANVFVSMFPDGLRLDAGRGMTIGRYTSSLLTHQGRVINLDFAYPDRFTEITGGNATVFVRHQDDFLRVSTSLKKQNGERASI